MSLLNATNIARNQVQDRRGVIRGNQKRASSQEQTASQERQFIRAAKRLLTREQYLAAAIRFFVNESRETARGLLYVSLVYLPVLLSVLTWDHVRLLS